MLSPGTLLQNRYRIKRQLAQGGMGAVYEAEAVHLGCAVVAVKETFFTEDWLREQFEHEAATLARLRHSALPKVTDHFTEGGGQFLVMEFIPGDDLLKLLEQQVKQRGAPFHWTQVIEWADKLLDALAYIHSQYPPVIHRDIKPQNLKLTPSGEIFLLDFGLAKDATTPTRPGGSVRGYTQAYAPPEQLKSTGTDARSDLFSLGATLYHLMTGQPPADAKVREEVIGYSMPDPLRPAHQQHAPIPFAVAAVLARAMSLDRERRYPSAAEMRQAFKQARQQVEAALAEEPRERQRQEAERKRLEQERALAEQRRLEEEERQRKLAEQRKLEEERQRQEQERKLAEQRKLYEERQRQEQQRALEKQQREEAARQQAEQQRREEAVRQRSLEKQRHEEETVPRPKPTPSPTPAPNPRARSRLIAVAVAVLLVALTAYAAWRVMQPAESSQPDQSTAASKSAPQPSTTIAEVPPDEALRYALELKGEKGRVTTLDPALDKQFKLHFTPRRDGFLYLLSPDKQNRVRTYLTGQRVKAGADFVFPDGDNWISSDAKAKQTRITIIFSAEPVPRPAVLSKEAGRELSGAEIMEMTRELGSPVVPSLTDNREVMVKQPADGRPLIFDIVLERKRGGS